MISHGSLGQVIREKAAISHTIPKVITRSVDISIAPYLLGGLVTAVSLTFAAGAKTETIKQAHGEQQRAPPTDA